MDGKGGIETSGRNGLGDVGFVVRVYSAGKVCDGSFIVILSRTLSRLVRCVELLDFSPEYFLQPSPGQSNVHVFRLEQLLTFVAGRLAHISDHYEKQNVDPRQWSHSLVVKGLLKQVYCDFNILEAWAALGNGLPAEESLEWSEADAQILKRKLEYHEGTPENLGREAQALSSGNRQVEESMWTKLDSRVATLTSPLDLSEMEKGSWLVKESAVMTLRTRSSLQIPVSYSSFYTARDEANFI